VCLNQAGSCLADPLEEELHTRQASTSRARLYHRSVGVELCISLVDSFG
jgi:allophanate hydrolase subunit 1